MAVKIDKRVFDAVKILQKSGVPASQAAGYMQITPGQAGRIYNTESIEEFQASTYLACQKARESKQKTAGGGRDGVQAAGGAAHRRNPGDALPDGGSQKADEAA